MILHHRALATLASPETHSFKIVNTYTGKSIECTLARETKCYYVMWSKELSGGRSLERRFHKATMSNDELMLIITVTADDVAQTEKEIAAKVAHNKADTAARIEAVKVREAATPAPIEFNAPHFCPACEGYCQADEMTASAWVTALICIDCATAEENALSATLTGIDCKIVIDMRPLIDGNHRRQAMIESVLEMNYIGGHLPGYHFTPTLKELPRNLFAYQPNNGREGSPNAIINTLGYYIVNLRRGFDTRALYDCLGCYVIHGDYDVINTYLIDLQGGV